MCCSLTGHMAQGWGYSILVPLCHKKKMCRMHILWWCWSAACSRYKLHRQYAKSPEYKECSNIKIEINLDKPVHVVLFINVHVLVKNNKTICTIFPESQGLWVVSSVLTCPHMCSCLLCPHWNFIHSESLLEENHADPRPGVQPFSFLIRYCSLLWSPSRRLFYASWQRLDGCLGSLCVKVSLYLCVMLF